MLTNGAGLSKENTVALQSQGLANDSVREDFSEYVAHLQLHMALQARNLVPTLTQTVVDSREELLHQTQATFEKLASRQAL
jgi:hypothetical protein